MKGYRGCLFSMMLLGFGWAAPCRSEAPAATSLAAPQPDSPFPAISGDQCWDAFRTGALFLDARQDMDYGSGHVPGAINLPVWAENFEDRLLDFLAGSNGQQRNPVVVYCGGCCSTDSLLLSQRLKEAGFTNVYHYRDGYPGWLRAGRPHVAGAAPNAPEVK